MTASAAADSKQLVSELGMRIGAEQLGLPTVKFHKGRMLFTPSENCSAGIRAYWVPNKTETERKGTSERLQNVLEFLSKRQDGAAAEFFQILKDNIESDALRQKIALEKTLLPCAASPQQYYAVELVLKHSSFDVVYGTVYLIGQSELQLWAKCNKLRVFCNVRLALPKLFIESCVSFDNEELEKKLAKTRADASLSAELADLCS